MKSSRTMWWLGIALAGALLLGAATARAQTGGTFDLSWLTIDGGGSTVTGGAYTLMGTFGQPEAGTSSGGSYTLEAGYWPSAEIEFQVYLPLVQR